jgi:hypothetical protein
MGGGGKGGSTTVNKTEIPPEVLARYNAVNARAEAVAQQPYQKYSNDPNAFVAPLTQTQQAGIQNTNAMAGAAQPYYQQATGLAQGSAYNVNPNELNVNQYMNPFTQNVVNATQAALQQQQGQQLAQQKTDAIRGGAFGGDRAGLQRAILQGQQGLATAQAISPLYQQNYNQALAAAQQQQGVNLGAQQANRANLQTVSQNLANLGTNAQQAGLAGAQAQLQAGQQQQQTEQAGKQAMYNQFMQEQGYPFQVAQFLANIATGTGALSGNQSTSTTTGGGGFFSDERLKENIQKVGETNDGQPIYRYNYKGDPRTQIGLMAQDVEKHHPEAVGLAGGYKTVDYKEATKDAVHKSAGGEMTDAYSMSSPSGMLAEPRAGLAPISLPAMRVGADIPIRAGADAAEIEALRAPKATGFSPGTMEGKRAELASLKSSIGRASDLGSGPGYMNDRMAELEKFLAANASQGGLVGPAGGSFARGGFAFGGGPYGVQLEPIAQRPMAQAQPGQRPAERNAVAEAKQFADLAALGYAGYKNRPDFLRSAADVAARQQTEAATKIRELKDLDWARKNDIDVDALLGKAHGGLIGDREAYRGQGYVNSSSNPYSGIAGGYLDDTLQLQQETPRPSLQTKDAPRPQPAKSGLASELTQMASLGKTGKNAFDWASKQLAGEASPTAMSSTIAEAAPGVAGATEASTGALGAATAPTGGVIDLTTAAAPGLTSAPLVGGAGAADAAAAAAGATEGAGLFGSLASAAAPVIEGITTVAAPVMAGLEALGPLALLFSDERMKHDIKKVGELYDGQPVYRYAYNGDDKTQMGLLAQKVEKIHPDAVGLAGGMKTVNYKKATDKAAKRGHYQDGSLVVPDEYSTAEPTLAVAEGGNETTAQGGDGGETKVPRAGLAPPLARPAARVPTPEDAIVTTTPATAKPRPGLEPPKATKPFFPEITSEGIKDTLSSENFWVPALAGVGAMLASPNKTLAGAIGSGLVGGTGAYTEMQKQSADQLMKRLQFNKDRFKGPVLIDGEERYQDTARGDWVDEATMQSRLGAFAGERQLTPSPARSTPTTTALTTAKEEIEAPKPKLETAGKPPATTPPATTQEAGAPAAGAGAPKPPATTQAAASTAQSAGQKVSDDPMAPPPSKLDLMNQARRNPALFADVPENRRPDYLEKEAQRLQAEAAEYQRQADQFAADARKLAKNTPAQGQYLTEATRLSGLATARRTEADQKNQAANKALEDAIGPALKTSDKLAEAQAELKMAGPKASEALKAKVAELHETLKHESEKYSFTENYKRQQAALTEAGKEAKDAQQLINQSNAILRASFDDSGKPTFSGGPLGSRLTNLSALMVQAGFSPSFVKDFTGTDPRNAQAARKLQTDAASEMVRIAMNGSPVRVSEFNQYLATTPGEDLLPEAMKWIVNNVIKPKAESLVGAYEKVKRLDPGKHNIEVELFDYRRDNPWFNPVKASEEETARGAAPSGQAPVEITGPDDIKKLKRGTPFVIPEGPNKGKIGYAQ